MSAGFQASAATPADYVIVGSGSAGSVDKRPARVRTHHLQQIKNDGFEEGRRHVGQQLKQLRFG